MELAVHEMGVKLIVVLGHTKCGAIAGACNHLELGHLSQLLEKIQPAVNAETSVLNNRDGDNYEFVDKVAAINVMQVIEGIKSNSQIINHAMQDDTVKIVGAMYHIENGKVIFYE
jgi:carbonic anhydrase